MLSGGAAFFSVYGQNKSGVVESPSITGFIDRYKTVMDYELLEKGEKLNSKSNKLLALSVGLGIVDAYNQAIKKPQDEYAFAKRLGRNVITTFVSYEFGKGGSLLGLYGCSLLGSVVPVAGTSAGVAIGATLGGIGGAYFGNWLCNIIFDKIEW